MGSGRKRLNISRRLLSVMIRNTWTCKLDQEIRRINEQFVNLLRLCRSAQHPETKKFILYLDNARY